MILVKLENLSSGIPKQNAPVMDRDTPTLMSKAWWMILKNIAQVVDYIAGLDFVFGGSTLTTIGAIPKVTAADTLGPSALTDDGASSVTVTERKLIVQQTLSGGTQPMVELDAVGVVDKSRVCRNNTTTPRLDLMVNVSFDGVNFNLDDTGLPGCRVSINATNGLVFAVFTAGANPRASTTEFSVDNAGNVNILGAFKINGTKVVGAQLGAVAVPTGGGTAVSAPTGGTTIDVQARAAISSIIAAISSGGNTVDPQARASINTLISRLQTTGITA